MSSPPPGTTTPTTKAQVQAYRFGMRRLENAVATGEPYRRTIGGLRRGMSFVIGVVLSALALVGFVVYAKISPEPSIGNARVVIDTDDGGAYVVRDHRLHPALNLASALLAAGGTESGTGAGKPDISKVSTATLSHQPKGQTLGISGAPNVVPGSSSLVSGDWTVCDVSAIDAAKAPGSTPTLSTLALLGHPTHAPRLPGRPAALVRVAGTDQTYLLWDGRRSLIAAGDRAVTLALGLDDVTPRPVSSGLLNTVPPGADLVAPTIDGLGAPTSWDAHLAVGTVLRASFSSGRKLFLALADGVEQITDVVADLIRAGHGNQEQVPTVPLSTVRQAPVSTALDQSRYPAEPLTYYSARKAPVLCVDWTGARNADAYTVFPAPSLPVDKASAVPAPPDAAAGSVDSVYVSPGHGAIYGEVQGNQKAAAGALFLVTDQGIKYPVISKKALAYLGLADTGKIRAASTQLLALLPTGPTLDPARAAQYLDHKPDS